mmetsp:Transcript_47678/g.147086  ORF Transcript_47678/g.147086 Transcript_47678/m.147086 type:complete len:216 (+) Transcript_47678:693-1340(+)
MTRSGAMYAGVPLTLCIMLARFAKPKSIRRISASSKLGEVSITLAGFKSRCDTLMSAMHLRACVSCAKKRFAIWYGSGPLRALSACSSEPPSQNSMNMMKCVPFSYFCRYSTTYGFSNVLWSFRSTLVSSCGSSSSTCATRAATLRPDLRSYATYTLANLPRPASSFVTPYWSPNLRSNSGKRKALVDAALGSACCGCCGDDGMVWFVCNRRWSR